MESKVNFAVVGLFVLILGAALIAGVLWLSSGQGYGKSYSTYRTYMSESVAGLNVNAYVKYHGVDVGVVRSIEVDPANAERVELTLAIVRGTPVKVDTVAILSMQGLTGIAFIDLIGGHNASPSLLPRSEDDVPIIPSGPSLFARLDTAASALLASVTRASDSVSALLNDENRAAFAGTLVELRTVSRTLASRAATIDAALDNASRTMTNAARFTDELPRLAARIQHSADGFDRMSEALAQAGASGAQTFDSTRTGLRDFTEEGLPELRQLVADLRETTSTLRRVSGDLERDPAMLVWGRAPAKRGPGE